MSSLNTTSNSSGTEKYSNFTMNKTFDENKSSICKTIGVTVKDSSKLELISKQNEQSISNNLVNKLNETDNSIQNEAKVPENERIVFPSLDSVDNSAQDLKDKDQISASIKDNMTNFSDSRK